MSLNLSMTTIMEKNRLTSDEAWLVLLEIQFQGVTLYLVRNTEGINWNNQWWDAFPFELGDISEDSKGEIPELTVKIANQTRQAQKYVHAVGGGVGAVVYLRVVNSGHLDIHEPDLELEFSVEKTETDENWVYFTLGGDNATSSRYPKRRIIKDFCPVAFKGIECGYAGAGTSCKKTLLSCRSLGNQMRFGGEASLPLGGLYVSNS